MALRQSNGVRIPLAATPGPMAFGFGGAPGTPLHPQLHSNWCWAACIQMVGDAPPSALRLDQPSIVRKVKTSPCFQTTNAGLCNDPATVPEIDKGYQIHGIASRSQWSQIAPAALSSALGTGKPVEIGWKGAGVGHVVLVIDEQPSGEGPLFTVNDPKPATITRRYSELQTPVNHYSNGTWVATWTF
jgi:hypothetical protein